MAQTPVDRLVELSMVPELAKEVRSQIESSSGGAQYRGMMLRINPPLSPLPYQ
ncbi:hypothetical protein [Brucella phage EF4]|uniref:Uncharacterized protein n=1 Tax=Brucella phage EF4 TaxID=2706778 RepID=A0A6C0X1X9_9CAUD|nr:hypothetical protein [Brucella phage EF4]